MTMDNTAESVVENAPEAMDTPIEAIENAIAEDAAADGEVVPDHGMMRVLEAMLFASAEPLSLASGDNDALEACARALARNADTFGPDADGFARDADAPARSAGPAAPDEA